MSASFLDHISISALATSPPATSALCWNNTDPQRQQQQLQRSDANNVVATNNNNHNNNNFSTINNNNHNLNNISHTHCTSNNITNSRRSSSDAITTNSQAIGWIVNDATVPRSNSCSSTSNNRRFNHTESIDKADKCQSDGDRCEFIAIPSIDDTSSSSPAHSGTEEMIDDHTKINRNDGDDGEVNEDGNGDHKVTSENVKGITDEINGPNNSCL